MSTHAPASCAVLPASEHAPEHPVEDPLDPAEAPLDALPDALPDEAPDALPDALPDEAPDALPDALPDEAPDALPDALPDEAPDALPDALPEALPDGPPLEPRSLPATFPPQADIKMEANAETIRAGKECRISSIEFMKRTEGSGQRNRESAFGQNVPLATKRA
jgi:hypothetical protein